MDERYIAAVDLGSSKIALTVAKVCGNDIQIDYYKETPSVGIRSSIVKNPSTASQPVKAIIQEAEKALGIRIMQVVVGLPRDEVRMENNSAMVTRSNPEDCISEEEVEALKSIAQESYPNINTEKEEIYGAVAQSFDCDDNFQVVENEVVGMLSEEFTGNFKLFIGKKSNVTTIDRVFNMIGIGVAKKYFTPDCVAKAVLTEGERQSGVALIDFGGGATSVTIYKGKILRHYACIPFGGKSVTGDICSECTIDNELAENIKLAFGACMPEKLVTLSEKIIQIEGEEGMTGPKQIPVKYMSEIITARMEEIVKAMLWEIQESGLADSLRSGIVITGGGAELANLAPYITDISGYTVRLGTPRHLFTTTGCPEAKRCSATTSLGIILSAKSEASFNCVEQLPMESDDDVEVVTEEEEPAYQESAAETSYEETAAEYAEEPVQEAQPENEGTGINPDLYEGLPGHEPERHETEVKKTEKQGWSLFGKKKEKEPKKPREPKEPKQPKEPKENRFSSVKWVMEKLEDMYENAGKENI